MESRLYEQRGVKKESITYPNGIRRESIVYPNGVRKDQIFHPDGKKEQSITYGHHAEGQIAKIDSDRRGSEPIKFSASGPPVSTMGKRFSASSGTQHKRNSMVAALKKKSVVNFMAPPMKSKSVISEDHQEEIAIPKCCFCTNVRIGAIIIGMIELFGLAFVLYEVCHFYIDTEGDPESSRSSTRHGRFTPMISRDGILAGAVVAIILFLGAILSMFYGLWKKKTNYIVPHLVVQAFAILASLVGLIIAAIAVAVLRSKVQTNDTDGDGDLSDKNSVETYRFCVAILVFCIFSFLLEIYFFLVVRQCARFFNVDDNDGDEGEREMAGWGVHSDPDPPPYPARTTNGVPAHRY